MNLVVIILLLFLKTNFALIDSIDVIEIRIFETTKDTSVYIRISYPQIIKMNNKKIQDNINSFLKSEFLKSLEEYKEFVKDIELLVGLNNYPKYYFETSFRTAYISNEFISLILDNIEYTGGAHPNHFSQGYNINLSNGSMLKLSDIIEKDLFQELSTNYQEKLLKQFSTKSLLDVGFFVDKIQLNEEQDFYVKPDSLVIQFDPYEIATYATGSIEVELMFAEIKNLLKPNLPFK